MLNVYHTRNSNPSQNLSRKEIIKWINSTLNIDIKKLEALGSGAEYCQLFNQLHPGTINLKKVKHGSHLQADYQANFLLLQRALQKVGVDKDIQIGRMIVGGCRENLDFAQWFKKLYDRNIDKQDTVFQDVSEPSKQSSSKRSSSKMSSSKMSSIKRSSSKMSSCKRSSSNLSSSNLSSSQRSSSQRSSSSLSSSSLSSSQRSSSSTVVPSGPLSQRSVSLLSRKHQPDFVGVLMRSMSG